MFASQCDATKRNLDVRTLLSQVKNAPVNEDFARGQTEAFAPLGIKVKHQKYANLFICILHLVVPSIFIQMDFFASHLSSSGHSHVGWLVTKKNRERLACDTFDPFVTHTGLVCYIINKDCWAQNNCDHSCIFMIFTSNGTRNRTKTCCMNIFVPFLSITTVMLLWFGSPLSVPHINKIER